MQILFWILVTYVTLDLAASAYVVYRNGGIKATVRQVRQNWRWVTDDQEDDDVYYR